MTCPHHSLFGFLSHLFPSFLCPFYLPILLLSATPPHQPKNLLSLSLSLYLSVQRSSTIFPPSVIRNPHQASISIKISYVFTLKTSSFFPYQKIYPTDFHFHQELIFHWYSETPLFSSQRPTSALHPHQGELYLRNLEATIARKSVL